MPNLGQITLTLFLLASVIAVIVHQQLVLYTKKKQESTSDFFLYLPAFVQLMSYAVTLYTSYFVLLFLRSFDISMPYCSLLFFISVLWGIAGYYNKIVRLAQEITNYTPSLDFKFVYVPGLLFSTSFCMDSFVLFKALPQITVIGLPVTALMTLLFGTMANSITGKKWTNDFGLLLGVFIAPVAPKYIASFLKQQSTRTRQICVLLEGEALFTIIIADMINELYFGTIIDIISHWYQIVCIILRFIVLGVLTGFMVGLGSRYLMKKMSMTPYSVYIVCLIAPFFCYAVARLYISGCGAIAVVVLGLMLASERSLFPTGIEKMLLELWEFVDFLLDVLVVVKTGLSVTTFMPLLEWNNYVMVVGLYLLYGITRLLCFLIFSPILSRMGYGMNLKNLLVCWISGIKTTFSLEICNLLVKSYFKEETACKFYFYIVGVYFLSVCVKAPLIYNVYDFLGLTEISTARQLNMNSCVKQLLAKREKMIAILKMDRFLADTNWSLVTDYTTISHPYQTELGEEEDDIFLLGNRTTYCKDCEKTVSVEPSTREMKEMIKEARRRILKAKKMSYARQYENGMMSREAIRVLSQAVELGLDSENVEINIEHLYQRFNEQDRWFQRCIRRQAEKIRKKRISTIKPPRTYWRRICYHIVITNRYYDKIMFFVVVFNVAFISADIYYSGSKMDASTAVKYDIGFLVARVTFTLIYLIDFIMKIMAYSWIYVCSHGFRTYFKSFWNIVDFFLLLIIIASTLTAIVNIGAYMHSRKNDDGDVYDSTIGFLRLARAFKLLQFFEIFYPDIINYLDRKEDLQMTFSYELGKSYATGEAEILEVLPYMIDNEKIRNDEKQKMENNKIHLKKLLGLVQKERPWIAITVKTKQAIRTILHAMFETINALETKGWIENHEHTLLSSFMNDLYKNVNSIKKVNPTAPKVIFKEVAWMAYDEAVIDFLFENVTVKKFEPGEIVFKEGHVADGIYIVVTGLFMITYNPDENILKSLHNYGILPVVDYLAGTKYEEKSVDYIMSGNCIGELSTLTNRCYNSVITAEAHSQVYVLSQGVLKRAMELNSDPVTGLECRIWKEVSIRIAETLLIAVPVYQSITMDQIKYILERAFVPDLSNYKIFVVSDMIEDIILIEGIVSDFNTRDTFTAPCVIPRTVQKLVFPASSLMNIPIRINVKLLIIPVKGANEYDIMVTAEEICELVNTGSQSECLQHLVQKRTRNRRKLRGASQGSDSLDSKHRSSKSNSLQHSTSPVSVTYFKNAQSETGAPSIMIPVGQEGEEEQQQKCFNYDTSVNTAKIQRSFSPKEKDSSGWDY